jgi:hypothetical protein
MRASVRRPSNPALTAANPRVPDVLIYGDTIRSPELRREVPLAISDAFRYLEHGGRLVAAIHSPEVPRLRGQAGLEILPTADARR